MYMSLGCLYTMGQVMQACINTYPSSILSYISPTLFRSHLLSSLPLTSSVHLLLCLLTHFPQTLTHSPGPLFTYPIQIPSICTSNLHSQPHASQNSPLHHFPVFLSSPYRLAPPTEVCGK